MQKLLPRGLLARASLIIIAPYLALMLILIQVFQEAHWQPLTNRLTSAVVNELELLVSGVESATFARPTPDDSQATPEDGPPPLVNLPAVQRLGIRAVSVAGAVDLGLDVPQGRSTLDQKLRERLAVRFPDRQVTVNINFQGDNVLITLDQRVVEGLDARHYRFIVTRRRLFNETGRQFMYLVLGTGFLMLIPSFIFLRNQIRPIRNLAREAAAYGRGEAAADVPVRGAREVRQATLAFRDMRARITRAIDQRTNMLSGVSHDLRTPLTRLKLQLAMMPDGEDKRELEGDLSEMEAMLEGYLDYARGNVQEADHLILVADLVRQAIEPQKWPGLRIQPGQMAEISVKGRRTALLRLINNLLSNAQRHASHAFVEVRRSDRTVQIVVQDNGPGIEADAYEQVLQPFQRLDESRNLDAAGVGLGLTVCQDIARSHGGRLRLGRAPQGGLQVIAELPL